MGDTFVSSRELVEEIWRHVANERDSRLESNLRELPPFARLNDDTERHYINAQYLLETEPSEVHSAKPFAGLKRKLKRRGENFLMAALQRYFADEQDFLAHLVRFQNDIAEGHDHLAREVTTSHQSIRLEFERLRAKVALLEESIEQRMAALEGRDSAVGSREYA